MTRSWIWTGVLVLASGAAAIALWSPRARVGDDGAGMRADEQPSPAAAQSGARTGAPPSAAARRRSQPARHAVDPARGTPVTAEQIARLEQLAERQDVAALPWLMQSVLADQPDLAPTIILTVARLAEAAPDADRDAAARTLGQWLDAEAVREGRDARGNTAVLVEALAIAGGPEAVDALARALDAQHLPLHQETLAVQGLFKLGDPRAREAVQRWNERVAALPQASGLQEALRKEAELAAYATLSSFGS